jgi:hypothetical protein
LVLGKVGQFADSSGFTHKLCHWLVVLSQLLK